jgi:hypothetical protein
MQLTSWIVTISYMLLKRFFNILKFIYFTFFVFAPCSRSSNYNLCLVEFYTITIVDHLQNTNKLAFCVPVNRHCTHYANHLCDVSLIQFVTHNKYAESITKRSCFTIFIKTTFKGMLLNQSLAYVA